MSQSSGSNPLSLNISGSLTGPSAKSLPAGWVRYGPNKKPTYYKDIILQLAGSTLEFK